MYVYCCLSLNYPPGKGIHVLLICGGHAIGSPHSQRSLLDGDENQTNLLPVSADLRHILCI